MMTYRIQAEKNDQKFTADICDFNGDYYILIQISLNCVPINIINNNPELVQVMA